MTLNPNRQPPRSVRPPRPTALPRWRTGLAAVVLLASIPLPARATESFQADPALVALDRAVDWSAAKLIAVQDGNRYKTLDSFARETISAMVGRESFPGLSPLASMFEWLFNRAAYADVPLVRIKDMGIRIHFTAHMPIDRAQAIRRTGYMTLREFASPVVEQRKEELRPRAHMGPAMRRVGEADATAQHLEKMIRIVPRADGPDHAMWLTPEELLPSLPAMYREMARGTRLEARMDPARRVAGVSEETAEALFAPWSRLEQAWLKRDAAGVNEALGRLVVRLPQAAGDVAAYPALAQRKAEAKYYAMGKFTWGWGAYFIGAIASVWALITRWRWSFVLAQAWLLVGLAIHAYGIGLRWQILGHIPVSNMFEAVTASAWMGISIMLGLELADRFRGLSAAWRNGLLGLYVLASAAFAFVATRAIWYSGDGPVLTIDSIILIAAGFVILGLYAYLLVSSIRALPRMVFQPAVRPVFLMAANVTGFFALIIAAYVIPGGGTLSSIRAILDDVMLRIHTTLIIASYALIFFASIVAVAYLFGYYMRVAPQASMEAGAVVAMAGIMLILLAYKAFAQVEGHTDSVSGFVKREYVAAVGWTLTVALGLLIVPLLSLRTPRAWVAAAAIMAVACLTLAIGDRSFVWGMGVTFAAVGAAWFLGTLAATATWQPRAAATPALAGAGAGLGPAEAGVGGRMLELQRPVLAGGAPGDENQRNLPRWLHDFDWCHLIILNLVFILLFVGIVLGAVWADYSWGRPWGWDPKEVFAMNTWIIYAILIHTRFVVANKGLWTAWLSVAGCLMMAFNWCFVNFFIVGLHSYA